MVRDFAVVLLAKLLHFSYSYSSLDFPLTLWASHSPSNSQQPFLLKIAKAILCWLKTGILTIMGLMRLWGLRVEEELVKDELLSREWCLNPFFLSHPTPKTLANLAISGIIVDSKSINFFPCPLVLLCLSHHCHCSSFLIGPCFCLTPSFNLFVIQQLEWAI